MLTRAMIREQVEALPFARGMRIFEGGNVIVAAVGETDRCFFVIAQVKDENGEAFYPTLYIDKDTGVVDKVRSVCSCVENYRTHEICEHLAAVLFYYSANESEIRRQAVYVSSDKGADAFQRDESAMLKAGAAGQGAKASRMSDAELPATEGSSSASDNDPLVSSGRISASVIPSGDYELYHADGAPERDSGDEAGAATGSDIDASAAAGDGAAAPLSKAAKSQLSRNLPKSCQGGTTSGMRELIQQHIQKKTLPVIDSKTYGQVCLAAEVSIDDGDVDVSFKIGAGKMYVLKDLITFADQMKGQEEVVYGKNLRFVHMREAFAPESLPMLDFILEWVAANRESFRNVEYRYNYSSSYYYDRYQVVTYSKVRSASLMPVWIDRFFKAAAGQTVAWTYADKGIMSETMRVCGADETVLPTLKIRGYANGITLSTEERMAFLGSEYTWDIDIDSHAIAREKTDEGLDNAELTAFRQLLLAAPKGRIVIDGEDAPGFCRVYLPMLRQAYQIDEKDFDASLFLKNDCEIRFYLDSPQENMIEIRTVAVYGPKTYSVYDPDSQDTMRDPVKEATAKAITEKYANAFNDKLRCMVILDDEDKIYELLTTGIPEMQMAGKVFISGELKKMKVRQAPQVTVGISLSGDLLEITMNAEGMPKEQLVEVLSRYRRKKKYFRLKDGSFLNMEGSGLEAASELKDSLQLTDKQIRSGRMSVPKFRALYLDSRLSEMEEIASTRNREFRALVRNMKTVEDSEYDVPEELAGVLRGYQKYGFRWLKTLSANSFGGILADEMGLGKTLQVIAFLLSEFQETDTAGRDVKPVLIVTPASLVYNWKKEFEHFAPEMDVLMIAGNAAERRRIISSIQDNTVYVTSYDLLKRDIESYEKISFSTEVIDEAQFIKNSGTQAAKAVKLITSGFRLALTGTPMENRLSELWSIFDYLMPGYLYSYESFRKNYELPIVTEEDEATAERLRKLISLFILRRLKKDVLKDLPDKLEETVAAEMTGEQRELYEAHVQRLMILLDKTTDEEFKHAKIQILAELTKLRQLCCDPGLLFEDYKGNSSKSDLCLNLIQNAVEGGHKVLLFSQFTTMLGRIEERLDKEKIDYYELTGATSKKERAELVEKFNTGDVPVFCISLKAGGTGLNLTAADIVIHYDPWWNRAVEEQASDRAHRIGQKNVVTVYRLVMEDTIEENIVKLQEKKAALADSIFGGGEVGSGTFTRDELLELLQ